MTSKAEKKRVLLIFPPGRTTGRYSDSWFLAVRDYGGFPPLGLLYLAARTREATGAETAVIDAQAEGLTFDEIAARAAAFSPDVVGVSAFTVSFFDTISIARAVREASPRAHICVGGPHLNVFARETIARPEFDSAVVGEGENVFPALVAAFDRDGFAPPHGVLTRAVAKSETAFQRNTVDDLDSLPFPARDLIAENRYSSIVGVRPRCFTIITSRGCPFHCAFCDTPHTNFRVRSIENVMAEIDAARPARDMELFIYDDIFNITKKRVVDFASAMARRRPRMPWSFRARADRLDFETLRAARAAGCFQIHIGVETTTDENLELLNKEVTMAEIREAVAAARKAGIRVIADHMIGLPFEKSEADVYDNLRRLIGVKPTYVQINIFQPLPGTALFDDGVKRGVIHPERWTAFAENPVPDFRPQTWDEFIPRGELGRIFRRCYRMFYFRPAKIAELALNVRSLTELKRKAAGALRLLSPLSPRK